MPLFHCVPCGKCLQNIRTCEIVKSEMQENKVTLIDLKTWNQIESCLTQVNSRLWNLSVVKNNCTGICRTILSCFHHTPHRQHMMLWHGKWDSGSSTNCKWKFFAATVILEHAHFTMRPKVILELVQYPSASFFSPLCTQLSCFQHFITKWPQCKLRCTL